jgi:hypothetical protein
MLPPIVPFTLQFTDVLLAPLTVAVSCSVSPSKTLRSTASGSR